MVQGFLKGDHWSTSRACYLPCHDCALTTRQAQPDKTSTAGNFLNQGGRFISSAWAKAESIITKELSPLGWEETGLASRRKSDLAKLQIAARLRRETTYSVKQIASCLYLGTSRSASVRLHTAMRQTTPTHADQGGCGI
jgi:hypothetical protein